MGLASLLAMSCGGEYQKQLGMAKQAKCELAAVRKKLDGDRENVLLKEEYLRVERRIKIHLELSGDEAGGRDELKKHSCP